VPARRHGLVGVRVLVFLAPVASEGCGTVALAGSHRLVALLVPPETAAHSSDARRVLRRDWQPGTRAWQGRPDGRFLSLWMYRNTKSEGNGRSAYGNQIYERLMLTSDDEWNTA
jgi:hypothetical protein